MQVLIVTCLVSWRYTHKFMQVYGLVELHKSDEKVH